MFLWPESFGKKRRRRVKSFWWPPTLIARQAMSALLVGALTRWRKLPRWFVDYGFKCLPGAAGSKGMGCIGFPDHPVWEMTTACNLNCIHCHTAGGAPRRDELTTGEAEDLLSELAQVESFRMMAFTGGEPLMRPDLFELLAYSQALGFKNTIATNATLIDDNIAQRMRAHGVVIAAVSLDGITAQTHDRIRGLPGSFEKAVQGMRALTRAGILLHINITAMEYNVTQMERLMVLVDELKTGI
ncbi:MAG: radical SAM protein, partial [bacterium]